MTRAGRELADWAAHEIETKYKDDVSLLVTYNTLHLAEDRSEITPCSYTPRPSRSNGLALPAPPEDFSQLPPNVTAANELG